MRLAAFSLCAALFACASSPSKTSVGTIYSEDTEFHPSVKQPFFTKTRPNLCFDEGHNNLSYLKGRYRPVLELLKSDGIRIEERHDRFSKENLATCDLVYISAANPPGAEKVSAFTPSEVDAIRSWVKRGGGLLLATDHSPMADAMESVLESFGVQGSLYNVRNPSKPIPPFKKTGIVVQISISRASPPRL